MYMCIYMYIYRFIYIYYIIYILLSLSSGWSAAMRLTWTLRGLRSINK